MIVDPEPFFCAALSAALSNDGRFDVVGWAIDERNAAAAVEKLAPDIVISEVALSPGSGLSLARRLGEAARVLIVTREEVGDVILDAVEAGAQGCLGHEAGVEELAAAIDDIAGGRFAIGSDRIQSVLRRISANRDGRGAEAASVARLSPREREVLRLLAQGLDNEAIGARLYLSAHTVRTHVGRLMRKLGAHSRADAARIALRIGETDPGAAVLRIEGPRLGGS